MFSHRDTSKFLCINTDVCDDAWSGIASQAQYTNLMPPHEQQRHEPRAFVSERITTTQIRWFVLEKAFYAIVASLERLHCLAATTEGIDLHTVRNNMIFIFDPWQYSRTSPFPVSESSYNALRVSVSTIANIFTSRAPDNLRPDILLHCAAPSITHRLIKINILPATSPDDFVSPKNRNIQESMESHPTSRLPNTHSMDSI